MYVSPPPPSAAQIWLAKWSRIWTVKKKVEISVGVKNMTKMLDLESKYVSNYNTYIYLTWMYHQLLVSIAIMYCMYIKNYHIKLMIKQSIWDFSEHQICKHLAMMYYTHEPKWLSPWVFDMKQCSVVAFYKQETVMPLKCASDIIMGCSASPFFST